MNWSTWGFCYLQPD